MELILTTLPTKKKSVDLSKKLVKEKLAACVQVLGPIQSIYTWNKKIEQQKEYILLVKTKKRLSKIVYKFIKDNHPYVIPEIISLSISNCDNEYLKWLNENTI